MVKKREEFQLLEGSIIEYIYEFGDDIKHIIKLEKMVEPFPGDKYHALFLGTKKVTDIAYAVRRYKSSHLLH
ncbi:plasmid pRiA4b ORF-3 family protein [Methanosalsum natronophilum]|uniref:plasmid pRiA4b ORF-3 family protein n=1 Tax=Methanosalsum natronophilum TaxID=768733 RepID=UPI0021697315|nr:plasmid pRiA4b ORF-3 family protein [Methanosalsum natronophilum]MCS3923597.1 hypothetical protein [Methanosalsum natronophilum]